MDPDGSFREQTLHDAARDLRAAEAHLLIQRPATHDRELMVELVNRLRRSVKRLTDDAARRNDVSP
jgi:hypothetical protein